MFESGVGTQVKGPTSKHLDKTWEMKDTDGYTETLNNRKILRKTQ